MSGVAMGNGVVATDNTVAQALSGLVAFAPTLDFGTITAGLLSVGRVDSPANNYIQFGNSGTAIVFNMVSTGLIQWSNSATLASGTKDLILARDAAGILATRNGTNAQAFRVYNTYTDGSNNELLNVAWIGNEACIFTANNGTGVARVLKFGVANVTQWQINTSGHFQATTDATTDIGASSAFRPRNVYLASSIWASQAIATTAGGNSIAGMLMGTTGFGIYFGSGLPTVSAAQGSLYIRSDGSSTATRLYVNTNGTTGWTNVTTAT